MQPIRLAVLLPYYFRWHYFIAPQRILHIGGNFVWFFWNFFSIGLLFGTLFQQWQRLGEDNDEEPGLSGLASKIIINFMMRITGAIIRIIFILIGLIFISVTIILTAIGSVVWIALPIVIIFFMTMSGIFFGKVVL